MRKRRASQAPTKDISYETLDAVAEYIREGREDMSVNVRAGSYAEEWGDEVTVNYRRPIKRVSV